MLKTWCIQPKCDNFIYIPVFLQCGISIFTRVNASSSTAGFPSGHVQCSGTKMSPSPQSVSFYIQNQDMANILDNMDVYILPVMNPDGYQHTWTAVRHAFTRSFFFHLDSWPWSLSSGSVPRTGCGGRTARSARAAAASGSTSTGTSTPTGAVSVPAPADARWFLNVQQLIKVEPINQQLGNRNASGIKCTIKICILNLICKALLIIINYNIILN